MQYIERVRKYTNQQNLPLNEAVEHAVTECIREGILKDFLTKNRAEAITMSIFEFDAEKEWRLFREAEYQNGVDDGIELGRREGKLEGIEQGKLKGIEQGKLEGIEQGKKLSILEMLEELGEIPKEISERIMSEKDTTVLKQMLKLASKSDSMEQFREHFLP